MTHPNTFAICAALTLGVLSGGCLEQDLEEKTSCRYSGDCFTGLLCHQGMCMTREQADTHDPNDMGQDMRVTPDKDVFVLEDSMEPTPNPRDTLFTLFAQKMEGSVPLTHLRVRAQIPGHDTWALNFRLAQDNNADQAFSQGDRLEVSEPPINFIDPLTSRTYIILVKEVLDLDTGRTRTLHSFVWEF